MSIQMPSTDTAEWKADSCFVQYSCMKGIGWVGWVSMHIEYYDDDVDDDDDDGGDDDGCHCATNGDDNVKA